MNRSSHEVDDALEPPVACPEVPDELPDDDDASEFVFDGGVEVGALLVVLALDDAVDAGLFDGVEVGADAGVEVGADVPVDDAVPDDDEAISSVDVGATAAVDDAELEASAS